jgi:hypothetical protein
MEYSYQQYLSFLPDLFRGTSLTLSYTRTYTVTPPGILEFGVIPHSVKGTVGWRYRRVNLSFSGIWQDNSGPSLGVANRYQKANTKFDLTTSVKLSEHVSFQLAGRNIFQAPHLFMETSPGNAPVLFRYENYGTNWTIGVKGTF